MFYIDTLFFIIKRPFITIGFFTVTSLVLLAATSNNAMVKRLGGKRWKRLHKLTYFIAIASCIHFYMLVKADKTEPLQYAVIVFILLAIRLYRYYLKQTAIKVVPVRNVKLTTPAYPYIKYKNICFPLGYR